MVNFDPTTGKWTDSGGGQHDSRNQAQMRDNAMGGSSGGNGFAEGMLAALWKFFCLIPRLLGLAVGGLCGLILKLNIAGKVILSLLAAAGVLIVLAIIANETRLIDNDNMAIRIITGIVMYGAALLVGAWFWLRHYKVLRQMPYRDFVSLTTKCVMICFWGPIGYYLIFAALKLFNIIKSIPISFPVAIGIALAIAVAYWIFKANAYEAMEPDTAHSDPSPGTSPTPVPSGNQRCSPGDIVWARWSGDGNLYLAGVAGSSDAGVRVVYYDGTEEEVNGKDVFYLSEAQQSGLTPHGNWQNKGSFYPGRIIESRANSVIMIYAEDNVKEELPYHGLVFMN